MEAGMTDPGERTRREQQAFEDANDAKKSRYETMKMLIALEFEMKLNRDELKAHRKALQDHITDDRTVQGEIKGLLSAHAGQLKGVTSNVGDLQSERDKVIGIRDAVFVLARALVTVVGAAWVVWVTFFKGHP